MFIPHPCAVFQIHSPASLQRRCWPSTQPPSSQTSSSRDNSVGGRAQVSLQRQTRLHGLREPQVLFPLPSAHISSSKWPEIPAGSMAPAHRAGLIQNRDACWQLQTSPVPACARCRKQSDRLCLVVVTADGQRPDGREPQQQNQAHAAFGPEPWSCSLQVSSAQAETKQKALQAGSFLKIFRGKCSECYHFHRTGSSAEVPTGLHHPLPESIAGAGAEETREEGAGGLLSWCWTEDSPQGSTRSSCSSSSSQWYRVCTHTDNFVLTIIFKNI